ncbi:hypothetical protein HPB51_023842 [Rhipicephalus microplus]|uniref:Uncharacterized protein n=1 Tax=Rhipicephalus microplus TaxID=6941 RepID=A0A9J6F6E4_RHIMP|nr:hypothetical protein HPB51_023842 [Rhipicephalus microplus]
MVESEARVDGRVEQGRRESEQQEMEWRSTAPTLSYTFAPHAPVDRGEDKRACPQLLLWERGADIVADVSDDSVGVQIAAPPVDGEANTELIRFLSKLLNLRKSDLSLEKGSRSKDKVVLITAQTLQMDQHILLYPTRKSISTVLSSLLCWTVRGEQAHVPLLPPVSEKLSKAAQSGSPFSGAFVKAKGLHALDLSENKLVSVPSSALQDLSSLTSLNLSNNLITELSTDAFVNLHSLRILSLEKNRVSSIAVGTFYHMEHLEDLNLSHNKLSAIDSKAFGKTTLETLRLSSNHLVSVSLENSLASLKHLDLTHNSLTSATTKLDLPSLITLNGPDDSTVAVTHIDTSAVTTEKEIQMPVLKTEEGEFLHHLRFHSGLLAGHRLILRWHFVPPFPNQSDCRFNVTVLSNKDLLTQTEAPCYTSGQVLVAHISEDSDYDVCFSQTVLHIPGDCHEIVPAKLAYNSDVAVGVAATGRQRLTRVPVALLVMVAALAVIAILAIALFVRRRLRKRAIARRKVGESVFHLQMNRRSGTYMVQDAAEARTTLTSVSVP